MLGLVTLSGVIIQFVHQMASIIQKLISVYCSVHCFLEESLLKCQISCLHFITLSQVFDNHIHTMLYLYNICQYIRYLNFLASQYWYQLQSQNPVSVGPFKKMAKVLHLDCECDVKVTVKNIH